jgi:hypothetical protein
VTAAAAAASTRRLWSRGRRAGGIRSGAGGGEVARGVAESGREGLVLRMLEGGGGGGVVGNGKVGVAGAVGGAGPLVGGIGVCAVHCRDGFFVFSCAVGAVHRGRAGNVAKFGGEYSEVLCACVWGLRSGCGAFAHRFAREGEQCSFDVPEGVQKERSIPHGRWELERDESCQLELLAALPSLKFLSPHPQRSGAACTLDSISDAAQPCVIN